VLTIRGADVIEEELSFRVVIMMEFET
jgi:hypothetical protein